MSSGAPLPGPEDGVQGVPHPRGDTLTLREAASAYGLDAVELERLAEAGAIPGAYRGPGEEGDTWRLPVVAMEGLASRSEQR